MEARLTYKQAVKRAEIYLGYINGKLCRFVLEFDPASHSYKKIIV